MDDECAIIDRAAKPVKETLRLFLAGTGEHEHPPLYDILFHGWLRLTTGNIYLLRIPSILFYIFGAWVLSTAAKRLGGSRSQFWTLLITVLSPFGFHFGRLATWYPFCFLLVSLLTLAYFKFSDNPTVANWRWLVAASTALIYANYLGWAFLGLLGIDYAIRNRHDLLDATRHLVLTGTTLVIAYLPILRSFQKEAEMGPRLHFFSFVAIANILYNVAYNIYSIFVSESVAPWHWAIGIPTTIIVAFCLLLTLMWAPPQAEAFLFYFLGLIVFLAALGAIIPKRIVFMAPWLLLSIGVTLGTMTNRVARRTLLAMLAFCASIGWYGICSRSLYAAPHWVEPWESIARRSADIVNERGVVIGNNPSFFFYLTYLLPVGGPHMQKGDFAGLLPNSVRRPGVYDPQQWIESGRPTASKTLLVKGVHYGTSEDLTAETQSGLDTLCTLASSERLVRDSGAALKQSSPTMVPPEWRIEVRTYSCP